MPPQSRSRDRLAAAGVVALVAAALAWWPGSAAAAPRDQLTLSFSGDLLIHSPIYNEALANGGGSEYDFAPFFRKLDPYVRDADIAFCHVEVPMSSGAPSGYPLFNTPPALAKGLARSGWDACDTASNHTLDQGSSGIRATIEALDRNGIAHAGSYATRKASGRTTFVRDGDTKVALLAYTTDTNGLVPPHSWSLNTIRTPGPVIRDARRARREGADVVIVNMHWGPSFAPEYSSAINSRQKAFAEDLTAVKAISAVVGQGPHVVQGIRWMNRKPVVFGEGNLISNQSAACCSAASQDGLVALIDFAVKKKKRPGRIGAVRSMRRSFQPVMVRYMPTFVSRPDYTVTPANTPALRSSRRRTVEAVGDEDRVRPLK